MSSNSICEGPSDSQNPRNYVLAIIVIDRVYYKMAKIIGRNYFEWVLSTCILLLSTF